MIHWIFSSDCAISENHRWITWQVAKSVFTVKLNRNDFISYTYVNVNNSTKTPSECHACWPYRKNARWLILENTPTLSLELQRSLFAHTLQARPYNLLYMISVTCDNLSANALPFQQSCTKLSICTWMTVLVMVSSSADISFPSTSYVCDHEGLP